MNLVLAFTWLLLGLGMVAHELVTGEKTMRLRAIGIDAYWLMFALSAWNFVRWYSIRASRETQRQVDESRAARYRAMRRGPGEYDPTFDFTGDPPPPPRPPTDRPPSGNGGPTTA